MLPFAALHDVGAVITPAVIVGEAGLLKVIVGSSIAVQPLFVSEKLP